MVGHVLAQPRPTGVIERAGEGKLSDGGHEAWAADSLCRHVAADDLQLDHVGDLHTFDRAGGGAHAASDLAALERRSGGRRGGEGALRAAEHDLTVGPDVHENAKPASRTTPVART